MQFHSPRTELLFWHRQDKYFYHVLDVEVTVMVLAEPATLKYIRKKILDRGNLQTLQVRGGERAHMSSCSAVINHAAKYIHTPESLRQLNTEYFLMVCISIGRARVISACVCSKQPSGHK